MKYKQHKEKWSDCERCPLFETRKKVVLARGKIPCDILFVGEGPGESEDILGRPFEGPAGLKLNEIIATASEEAEHRLEGTLDLSYAFTNIIACLPWSDEERHIREPTTSEAKACYPRLSEFLDLARPRFIVCLGAFAGKHIQKECVKREIECQTLLHPSFILQMGSKNPSEAIRAYDQTVVRLTNTLTNVMEGKLSLSQKRRK